MKLMEFTPEAAPQPLHKGRFSQLATSPARRWTLAIDEAGRNLLVLYHGPGWEHPGVLQAWSCARPKHAESGFKMLKRIFRGLDEYASLDAIARRLPRAESSFPRLAA